MIKKMIVVILAILTLTSMISCNNEGGLQDDTSDLSESSGGGDLVLDEVSVKLPDPPAVLSPIFVDGKSGSDKNDGSADDKAVLTFERAFALVGEQRNRIVIVNTVSVADKYVMPECTLPVVLTTKHGDKDYSAQNGAALKIGKVLTFNSDFALENITLTPIVNFAKLCGGFNNAYIGENVTVLSKGSASLAFIGGYNVPNAALNSASGVKAENISFTGDQSVTLLSGKWLFATGGNYREGNNSSVGTFNGNLTVNIAAGVEFTIKSRADDVDAHTVSAAGMNISKGTVTLNIIGGRFSAPIYALSRLGYYMNAEESNGMKGTDGLCWDQDVRFEADVTVNVIDADLSAASVGEVGIIQVPGQIALHGSSEVNIRNTALSSSLVLSAKGVLGESSYNGEESDLQVKFFDTVNGEKTEGEKPLRIAMVGDSITFGTGTSSQTVGNYTYSNMNYSLSNQLQKLFGEDAVVGNFGYPGSSYVSGRGQVWYRCCGHNVLNEFDPDVIVLALGTNSAAMMPATKQSLITMLERYVIKDLHKKYPDAQIILAGAIYRWDADLDSQIVDHLNPALKASADKYDYVSYIDPYTPFRPYGTNEYYRDKLHPNNKGAAKLAEVFKTALDEIISK